MTKLTSSIFLALLAVLTACQDQKANQKSEVSEKKMASNYLRNRPPLVQKPYLELPLGSIKATGWLLNQLERMRDGMTGNLDEIYPKVVGKRNGWLGGDGDGWERGPYWIDGLLPLAYILDDEQLKAKVRPWIEWTLNNQSPEGYIGPIPFETEPPEEPGLQRGRRRDWWPKMVMLKVLQQHYNATEDERVISVLSNYFRYQLKELPETPLDHWSFWANRRGGDNLQVVYWLYNITGDEFLLELAELINEQTFPWTDIFLNDGDYQQFETPWQYFRIKPYPFDQDEIKSLSLSKIGGIHTVNFAQGLKQPIVYYQQNPDEKYVSAVKKALKDIEKYHGQPQGMYGGDEPLHGNNPVQGIEFCAISEEMFSLETMLAITGDMTFAELLEKITYNALPAQASDDYMSRQYFQAANQIEASDRLNTSYQTVGHGGTDFVYGILTGYPCCTANMHQSWPKFVQNLFYATHDGGVAALLYAPSEVNMKVGNNVNLKIKEETAYPFQDEVLFTLEPDEETGFPFHLRIPDWAKDVEITINGILWNEDVTDGVAIINRKWEKGDQIKIKMPMSLRATQWFDYTSAIERGPLVYALKVETSVVEKNKGERFGRYKELYATSDWNYALYTKDLQNLPESVQIIEKGWDGSKYPWNLENAPIELKMRGVKIPEWKATNGVPVFPAWWGSRDEDETEFEEITLVPYGCTELRVTEFPVYGLR